MSFYEAPALAAVVKKEAIPLDFAKLKQLQSVLPFAAFLSHFQRKALPTSWRIRTFVITTAGAAIHFRERELELPFLLLPLRCCPTVCGLCGCSAVQLDVRAARKAARNPVGCVSAVFVLPCATLSDDPSWLM